MQERVSSCSRGPRRPRQPGRPATPKPDSRPTICTFHSLCARILRQHIEKLGYKRNFVIYDESEQIGAVKKILAQISAKGEKTDPGGDSGFAEPLSRTAASGRRRSPTKASRAMAEHIRTRYESALRACNAVDFDDLILLTLRLFTEHADALEACRAKYRYVMVDEYQDTNAAQFQLVHADAEHRNLCVVGDDDQSIYGWRGAEIANLLDMEKHFPEVKVIKLEQNYRSTNTILDAANAIIKHNVRRRGKAALVGERPGREDHAAHVCQRRGGGAERGGANRIRAAGASRAVGRQAILFRTNAQSRPLETALRQAGVRYHLIGGQSFFDRREIRDFLAYLKIFHQSARRREPAAHRQRAGARLERCDDGTAAGRQPGAQRLGVRRDEKPGGDGHVPRQGSRGHRSVCRFHRTHPRRSCTTEPVAGTRAPCRLGLSSSSTRSAIFEELRRSEKNAETAENRIRNLKELVATLDGQRSRDHAAFRSGCRRSWKKSRWTPNARRRRKPRATP